MKIKFSRKIRQKLLKKGLIICFEGSQEISKEIKLELPCRISYANLSVPLEVGAFSYFGEGFKNHMPTKIGRFCSIGENVNIGLFSHPLDRESTSGYFYSQNWFGDWNNSAKNSGLIKSYELDHKFNKVEIGDDVWIGSGAYIKGGVKIGKGAVVGCGAVVTKDVGDYEIVAGVPAKNIGMREIQEDFETKYYYAIKADLRGKMTYQDFKQFKSLRKKLKSFFLDKAQLNITNDCQYFS